MENLSKVKVHSILSVVSSRPIEPGQVHTLSLLDQAMGLHTIHVVFYYGSNPFNEGPLSSDLENLRVSLSHLLDKYPTITGRLARDGDGRLQIKCNDAGVRILHASVDTTLDEWLRSTDAAEERYLTVWEDMPQDPEFWSPFRIQINNFKCGSLAIGLSCTHIHADITSLTMFIKSWTETHRGLPLTHPPTFNLPPPKSSSKNLSSSFVPPNYVTAPSKMETITMKFSNLSIEKCLSRIKNPKLTPFDFLVALLWSISAGFQEAPPKDHGQHISICVDLRNHGIPSEYFGNAMYFSSLSLDNDKLFSGRPGDIAEYVHQKVKCLESEDLWEVMNQMKTLNDEGKGSPYKMYGPRLTFVNGEHMVGENGIGLMYDAMFKKEERPIHVSYHVGNVEGEGLIIVMPSSEPGVSRTVTITLPEEKIAKLCKNQAILDLEPIMLTSERK